MSVVILETNSGTITDTDGKFVIEVPEDSPLRVSYIGMESQVVRAQPQVQITLKAE